MSSNPLLFSTELNFLAWSYFSPNFYLNVHLFIVSQGSLQVGYLNSKDSSYALSLQLSTHFPGTPLSIPTDGLFRGMLDLLYLLPFYVFGIIISNMWNLDEVEVFRCENIRTLLNLGYTTELY
jgi:hypothetical protein